MFLSMHPFQSVVMHLYISLLEDWSINYTYTYLYRKRKQRKRQPSPNLVIAKNNAENVFYNLANDIEERKEYMNVDFENQKQNITENPRFTTGKSKLNNGYLTIRFNKIESLFC